MEKEFKKGFTKEKLYIAILVPVLLIIIVGLIVFNFVHVYNEYYIAPICTTKGGHYKECVICGNVIETESVMATGHKPATKITKESSAATMGVMETRCTVCKYLMALERTPAKISPIPSLKLIGRGMGMTNVNSIDATFTYVDGVESEEIVASQSAGSVKVRLMNSGERVDDKHSYVLNKFHVSEGDELLFGAFGDSEQIDIYANNDDPTYARRTIAYKQWKNLVSENYHDYSKYITVSDDVEYAGFNMLLYIKSTKPDYSFAGIYTLSVPYSVLAEKNKDADIKYVIRQTATGEEGQYNFRYVFGNSSEEQVVLKSLKSLLADSANVYEKIDENYINILVDYFTFSLITGNVDAFSDIYWVTSDGNVWYPVPANTEHTYGSIKGTVNLSATDNMTSDFGEFWNRLYEEQYDKIKARYGHLTSTRLWVENIVTEFERSISKLDIDVYKADAQTYNATFHDPYVALNDLTQWYTARLSLLDGMFEKEIRY